MASATPTRITPLARLSELGIELPPARSPKHLYNSTVVVGDIAYVSGALATEGTGDQWRLAYVGRLGEDIDVETAKLSARGAAINLLAALHHGLGSLDRVDRFVKLLGFVRATPDFVDAPSVIDGASQVLADVFGAELLPTRSAVGVASLPGRGSVELEATVLLRS